MGVVPVIAEEKKDLESDMESVQISNDDDGGGGKMQANEALSVAGLQKEKSSKLGSGSIIDRSYLDKESNYDSRGFKLGLKAEDRAMTVLESR